MTDARFPERWLNDRRIVRLPDDAFRLFVMTLAWSVANRTDGRIYDDDLPLIPGIPRSVVTAYSDDGLSVVPRDIPGPVLQLSKEGLWERPADYWLITVFEGTQTTRADLEVLDNARRRDREKKRRQRAKSSDVPGDKEGDSTRTGQARPGQDRQRREGADYLADDPDDDRDSGWPEESIGAYENRRR